MKTWLAEHRKMPARSAAFLFMMLGFACVAAAFQAAGAAPGEVPVALGIGKGALAGVLAAILGWASQKKEAGGGHEDFDIPQAVATAVVGAFIGAYAAWKHLPLADAGNLPLLGTVVMGAELVLKAVWRNGKVSLQRALGTVQAGAGAANPTSPAPKPPETP